MVAAPSRLPLVLIADDEPDVRHFLCTVLTRLGGRALAVGDGASAVVAIASRPQDVVAVMLDLHMPRLTGVEAAVAIRAVAPTLPIIVSSGYLSDHEHGALGRLSLTTLLHKPYTLPDLRAALLPHLIPVGHDAEVAHLSEHSASSRFAASLPTSA